MVVNREGKEQQALITLVSFSWSYAFKDDGLDLH